MRVQGFDQRWRKGSTTAPTKQPDSALVCLSFLGVYLFFQNAPQLETHECDDISVQTLALGLAPQWAGGKGDLHGTTRQLWRCASKYNDDHPAFVLSAFMVVYITTQTLAIPGPPVMLSILSGALYSPLFAQLLVAFCATAGASLCFMISYFLGNDIVHVLLPSMINTFRTKTEGNKHNLMYYLLFLRLTPLLPNWFVNVACPVVGVPLWKFAAATFIGLMPANYFHSQTGRTIASMEGGSLHNNTKTFFVLFCLQLIPLIPTLFKSKLKKLEEERFGGSKSTKTE